MLVRMSLYITINAKIDSRKLYEELKRFDMNVLDLGKKTVAYRNMDIGRQNIDCIIATCSKYGNIAIKGKTIV